MKEITNENAPLVEILLASYNGEKYIAEQINSILNQDYQNFKILIRDDGSKDKTPEIISEFESKYPNKIKIIHDDKSIHDPSGNFFELLKHADAEYIMFSDQDDYWLPKKIRVTLENMLRIENESPNKKDTPILVYADGEIVDSELKNPQGVFLHRHYKTFHDLLVYVCVTGCMLMANKALYKKMGDWNSSMDVHDRWMGLYASAFGVVYHIPEVVMLYRQHSTNVLGAFNGANKIMTIPERIIRFIRTPTGFIIRNKDANERKLHFAKFFKSVYGEKLSPEKLAELDNFIKLFSHSYKGKIFRIYKLLKSGYLREERIEALKQIFFI